MDGTDLTSGTRLRLGHTVDDDGIDNDTANNFPADPGRPVGMHDEGMPQVPITPRPLNASERAVLEHILSVDFDGASALRGQLDHVEAVATWAAGSPSIDLRVRGPVARASLPDRLAPVDAQVLDPSGEYAGELLVWVEDGAVLTGLEYAWVTDEPPLCLPTIENIHVTADQPWH